ncbi:MAG: rhomboid family intramembrane serine protease [Saprospiraceae bacterium]
MFSDLVNDLKYQIRLNGFWVKFILVCILVFIIINLSNSYFTFTNYNSGVGGNPILKNLSLSSDWKFNLIHPWVWITHMIVHQGFFHLLWNMLNLYWFGLIVEDLIGKKHAIFIVFGAGIVGGIFFLLACTLLPWYKDHEVMAYGSSSVVMGLILAAATISPNYSIQLILIGRIPIKYIALVLITLDILLAAQMNNSGGHAAHLGGAFFGYIYIVMLRAGLRVNPLDWYSSSEVLTKNKIPTQKTKQDQKKNIREPEDEELKLNRILEKIKNNGIDSISAEEKNYLDQLAEK